MCHRAVQLGSVFPGLPGRQILGYKHTTVYSKHVQERGEWPEKTNLSDFDWVLGRTASMVFNFVPLDDFFKPEINRNTTVTS